jgi:hypothetical protein
VLNVERMKIRSVLWRQTSIAREISGGTLFLFVLSASCSRRLNYCRFAKICYFFEDKVTGDKMFHAQWYEHGSQTILQEVAHLCSLYLIDECDSHPLDSIIQKVNVRVLDPTEDEPMEVQHDQFFTGYFCFYTLSSYINKLSLPLVV